jgi:hypothetical protein
MKVEHDTQVLHTMWRVINSSPYAFIYMCKLGPVLTTHMGKCHKCNLTLFSNLNTMFVEFQQSNHLFHNIIQIPAAIPPDPHHTNTPHFPHALKNSMANIYVRSITLQPQVPAGFSNIFHQSSLPNHHKVQQNLHD